MTAGRTTRISRNGRAFIASTHCCGSINTSFGFHLRIRNPDLRTRMRILDANTYGSERIQIRILPKHFCEPSKTICCLIENLSLNIIKYGIFFWNFVETPPSASSLWRGLTAGLQEGGMPATLTVHWTISSPAKRVELRPQFPLFPSLLSGFHLHRTLKSHLQPGYTPLVGLYPHQLRG